MKTVISRKTGEALEIAKQILYSLQVLTVGLLIPFLFVFGITYNTPKNLQQKEINIGKPKQANIDKTTVDFSKVLSDQNS